MASFSALNDHAVLSIASYGAPEDMLSLALTCRRLGSKTGAATGRECRALARDAKRRKSTVREWSLVNEAARCAIDKTTLIGEERAGACLPLRDGESWMGRYHEAWLRRPLTFDRVATKGVVGAATSPDKTKVWLHECQAVDGVARPKVAAVSDRVMRAGRHYATFAMTERAHGVEIGVFRPVSGEATQDYDSLVGKMKGQDRNMDSRGNKIVDWCTSVVSDGFGERSGEFYPFGWGGSRAMGKNDVAGLLLDLDEGTLAMYQNGRRLGIMQDGLSGEYCWGVRLTFRETKCVKMSRGAIPDLTNAHIVDRDNLFPMGENNTDPREW